MLVELEGKVQNLLEQNIEHKSELIYCGGGSFLAIVPEDKAESLKRKIERLYLDEAKTATVTVVLSKPIDQRDLEKGVSPHDEQVISGLRGKGVASDLLFSHFDVFFDHKRSLRKNFGEWVAFLSSKL